MTATETGQDLPLSFTQEFLTMFGTGEEAGPFGPKYHVVRGLRLRGELDVEALRAALDDIVARHESLRTLLSLDGQSWRQEIFPPSSPELLEEDLGAVDPDARERAAEEFLNRLETTEFSSRTIPHLRAVLGRFDEQDVMLALQAHHVAIDGWSMQLIMSDLIAAYSARAGHPGDGAPAATTQYREYSAWQRSSLTEDVVARSAAYWREKLRGASMLGIPTDSRRPEDADRVSSVHRFLIDSELTSALLNVARSTRSTPFMILMTAYNLLLSELTGARDITVPTITFGRGHPRFDDTVGPFFNFVPLRTDLTSCATVADALARTRETCIQAQTHEVPFALVLAEAPELMSTFTDDSVAVCAIQVFSNGPGEGRIGELEYSELRRRVQFQPVGSDIPDGALWGMEIDPSGEVLGCLRFDSMQFGRERVAEMTDRYEQVLRRVLMAPDSEV
ncbi:MAG: condensation domain-containing protein [Jatrophihabitantaceae bacterium]